MIKSVSLDSRSRNSVLIVFLFCLLSWTNCKGQELWTIDQFLNFNQDKEDKPYQENLNFLKTAKGMPLVDKYEFRTETDEMILDQQRFQFRFKFNSSDERKAYDHILIAHQNKYVSMQAQYALDAWKDKYKNLVDLYFCQKEMQLVKQELELLNDKKKVLKKIMTNETNLDVNDWISNESDIFNVLADSLSLILRKEEILQKMFGSTIVRPQLDETDFIPISKIRTMVFDLLNGSTPHPDEAVITAEKELASAELDLEEAEARRWLEFAQIQYQSDDRLSFQREISLSTSITIPSKSNNRIKKNEATLELLEKQYETAIEIEENSKDILLEEAKFSRLIGQLEEYIEMNQKLNLDTLFETYAAKKIVSPLVLIKIKRSMLANAQKQLNLEKDIYESYINILTQKAAFLKIPRMNYLKWSEE